MVFLISDSYPRVSSEYISFGLVSLVRGFRVAVFCAPMLFYVPLLGIGIFFFCGLPSVLLLPYFGCFGDLFTWSFGIFLLGFLL